MSNHKIAPVRTNPVLLHPSEHRLSLDGNWAFRLDPEDKGVSERWFQNPQMLSDSVAVPGCWQGQGHGTDAKETLWDFGLEARTFRATYKGTGWYGKLFHLPAEWENKRIRLNFGGVHPSAEVWLNGVKLGDNHYPFVPFGFDVTDAVRRNGENQLTVRVHEEARILGLAFGWQGAWSGLYRGVDLTAAGAFIDQFTAYPDVDSQSIRFRVACDCLKPEEAAVVRVSCRLADGTGPQQSLEMPLADSTTEVTLKMPSPKLWSPDAPNLYRIDAVLASGDHVLDALSERTGFVKLSTQAKHFLINGEPYYMRGTGDFLSNPETGCPDTDRDRWRRKLSALRAYGYNYVRCQSYVYGPEYYDVADEVGMLVQSEMGALGAWGGSNKWHVYAWPPPTPAFRKDLLNQWNLVVARDANHPSANIYCMSNELGAETLFPRTAWQCHDDTKAGKPSAFVIWTDGGYNEDLPGEFVNDEAAKDETCPKPLIQHEFRWWSSFPDVSIMHKYSGAIRPYSAQIALEAASAHGISHLLPLAAANSQRLQFVEAKLKMEMCRRDNPTLAGICHFNAMDGNPSPQGIIDEFYDTKYAQSGKWLQTNGDTVILSSLGAEDRVLASGDELNCTFSVSDFSHPSLGNPTLEWRLESSRVVIAEGQLEYAHLPYRVCNAGSIRQVIPEVASAEKARLSVRLNEGARSYTNEWDLWLFPKDTPLSPALRIYRAPKYTWLTTAKDVPILKDEPLTSKHVILTETFDEALADLVRSGGRVVLCASEGLVRPYNPKLLLNEGRYFFTPPANYPPMEDGHDGSIISSHPILGDFPHEGFADLQFYRMMAETPPIDLEPLGLDGLGVGPTPVSGAEPVLRVLHSYPVCRPLAYLTQYKLGGGVVVICSLDLDQSLPEARYLLARMCDYLEGEREIVAAELSEESIVRLIEGTSIP